VQPDTANIEISDSALLQQYTDGDEAVLERLITKYRDRIYNTILRICGNVDDAAELTQETFVKIIRNLDRFEGRSSLYTWAFRIAVNLTLNYCRRKSRTQMVPLDLMVGPDNEQAKHALRDYLRDESVEDPAAVIQNKEQVELILKAIDKLDEDQRAVVVLRDIENMEYNEIAKVLQVELGTVKSRISRARANLRENLGAILE